MRRAAASGSGGSRPRIVDGAHEVGTADGDTNGTETGPDVMGRGAGRQALSTNSSRGEPSALDGEARAVSSGLRVHLYRRVQIAASSRGVAASILRVVVVYLPSSSGFCRPRCGIANSDRVVSERLVDFHQHCPMVFRYDDHEFAAQLDRDYADSGFEIALRVGRDPAKLREYRPQLLGPVSNFLAACCDVAAGPRVSTLSWLQPAVAFQELMIRVRIIEKPEIEVRVRRTPWQVRSTSERFQIDLEAVRPDAFVV
ncbi:hypothetical protein SAMN05216270_107261 [Glycomyces harbinensis]|uniref:Uncharacterized protein n=1 Tax=Glycomyces harbinensis TaxID=58114 RepID=A0A1G6XNW1_9ACTN|nr:hypothetical protein SAMN05216270_107261 [Glycomyces harbinensis]